MSIDAGAQKLTIIKSESSHHKTEPTYNPSTLTPGQSVILLWNLIDNVGVKNLYKGQQRVPENEIQNFYTASYGDNFVEFIMPNEDITISIETAKTFSVSIQSEPSGIQMEQINIKTFGNPIGFITGSEKYGKDITGPILSGTQIEITAPAGFTKWHDESTENPRTFTIKANENIIAYCSQTTPTTYSVTATASTGGTVSGGGAILENTQVTLEAKADKCYRFIKWVADATETTDNPLTVTATKDIDYTAIFEENKHNVNITAGDNGSVTVTENGNPISSNSQVCHGTEIQISASPADGYTFVGWNDGNTKPTREITVNEDVTLSATFTLTPADTYTLTVKAVPDEAASSVSLMVDGNPINVPTAQPFAKGASLNISATSSGDYVFEKWIVDGVDYTTDLYSTNLNDNMSITAQFAEKPKYEITAEANPVEGGTVEGGGTYQEGKQIELTANASDGYEFIGWNDGNTDNPRTITVTEDKTYVANFNQIPTYKVELRVGSNGGGSVAGGGTYRRGTEITISAMPLDDYQFAGWFEGGGTLVSNEASYMIKVMSDVTYEARFTPPMYDIIVTTDGNGSYSGVTEPQYEAGTQLTLTATANPGFFFKHWVDANGNISEDNPWSFRLVNDMEIEAKFIDASQVEYGSQYNPITIENIGDYINFRDVVNSGGGDFKGVPIVNGGKGKYFSLETDIDLSAEPIAIGTESNPFKGTFNGKYHKISNINATGDYAGVFGKIDSATLKNVVVDMAQISGESYVGAICGYAQYSTIINCAAVGSVEGKSSVGGICGYAYLNTVISNCAASGIVKASGSQVGGICGFAIKETNIDNCYNAAYVKADMSYAGGICGFMALGGSIESCLNVGVDTAANYRGAIVGAYYNSQLSTGGTFSANNCYYDKQMAASSKAVDKKTFDGVMEVTTQDLVGVGSKASLGQQWYYALNRYPIPSVFDAYNIDVIMATAAPVYLHELETVEKVTAEFKFDGINWGDMQGLIDFGANPVTINGMGQTELVLTNSGQIARYIPLYLSKSDVVSIVVTGVNGSLVGAKGQGVNWDGSIVTAPKGNVVTLTGKPNSSYRIIGWFDESDAQISDKSTCTITADVSRSITLRCEQTPYLITVGKSGDGAGSVSTEGQQTMLPDESLSVNATEDEHSRFVGWYDANGRLLSTNPTYEIIADANKDVIAHFFARRYYVKASPSAIKHGKVSVVNSTDASRSYFIYGDEATVKVESYTGYTFANWTDKNGVVVSESPIYTFSVASDTALTANFTQSMYIITVFDAKGGTMVKEGKINGEQSFSQQYGHGDDVALVAQPLAGYGFVAWVEGVRDTVSRDASYNFKALKDRNLRACFRWVGTVSGIEDNYMEPFSMKIYPNPAIDRVTIEGNGMEQVEIYSMTGRLEQKSKMFSGQTSVELSIGHLMPGFYLVVVSDAQGQRHSAKLVKQ